LLCSRLSRVYESEAKLFATRDFSLEAVFFFRVPVLAALSKAFCKEGKRSFAPLLSFCKTKARNFLRSARLAFFTFVFCILFFSPCLRAFLAELVIGISLYVAFLRDFIKPFDAAQGLILSGVEGSSL